MSKINAVIELDDTLKPFRDMREHPHLLNLDTFIFVEQDVNQQARAARLRCLADEMESTAAYIRRLLEESRF